LNNFIVFNSVQIYNGFILRSDAMNVKIISSGFSEKSFENKVNQYLDFIQDNGLKIVEIQYRPSFYGYSAMIIYN